MQDIDKSKPVNFISFKMLPPEGWSFCVGERVQKKTGSSWRGFVVGYYWGSQTHHGVCVESLYEPGSVHIYPESLLERMP